MHLTSLCLVGRTNAKAFFSAFKYELSIKWTIVPVELNYTHMVYHIPYMVCIDKTAWPKFGTLIMWHSYVRSWMSDAFEFVILYRFFSSCCFSENFFLDIYLNGSFRNASGIWLRNVTKIRNNFLSPNSLDSC